MSYDTERYSLEKLSNQSFSVIECGLQICHSGHSSGKLVYPDYSAHFILEGKGIYYVNGKEYPLSRGQGFLITPNIPNVYIADKTEPWRYIYATFKGPDAAGIVHNAGLSDEDVTFSFPLDDEMLHDLECMHASGKDYLSKGYDVLGYFLLVMSRLVKENSKKAKNALSEGRYIKLACSYMEDRIAYGITINDVANYVRIDRSHLYRLFVKHLGISPSNYLINIKLKRAVDLMDYDTLSVNDIALSSGFYDLSHFSRVFAEKYGTTPGEYRKKNK